jgi:hypothetical protein
MGCPWIQIPKNQSIWTHLKQIQSLSWNLPSTLACILILQIMMSERARELALPWALVLSMNQLIDFLLQKWCHV